MTVDAIMAILRKRLGDEIDNYLLPPPVFTSMGGEFVSIDLEAGLLTTRFPVREDHLNPYRAVQGGVIAAMVDNTLGPLSMLVALPNVTRRFEIKFSRSVIPEMESVTVKGRFLGREGRRLSFTAEVRGPARVLLARAKATHWILGEN